MSAEAIKLKEIIALCKASGVTHVKIGDVELEFAARSGGPITPQAMAAIGKALGAEGLSDEEVLFYSAGQLTPEKNLKEH